MELEFSNPEMIWFLLGLPVLVATHFLTLKLKKSVALKFSNFELLMKTTTPKRISQAYAGALMGKDISILVLRFLTLTALIFSVAGTSIIYTGKTTDVDFVIAIDTSNSMNAQDLLPTRFLAAKDAAKKFIDAVPFLTQIGFVSFSTTTKVERELSDEKTKIKDSIDKLSTTISGGTDIGGMVIAAVNVLVKSDKHKSIIIFTDGQSNIGVPLMDALNFAKREGVTVHTIGVGTREGGTTESMPSAQFQLDEGMLMRIAQSTGGKYFRASDQESLKKAYESLSAIKVGTVKLRLAPYLLLVALILLFVEWGIVNIKYRTVP